MIQSSAVAQVIKVSRNGSFARRRSGKPAVSGGSNLQNQIIISHRVSFSVVGDKTTSMRVSRYVERHETFL